MGAALRQQKSLGLWPSAALLPGLQPAQGKPELHQGGVVFWLLVVACLASLLWHA